MNYREFTKMLDWMKHILHLTQSQIDKMPVTQLKEFVSAYDAYKAVKGIK